MQKKSKETGKKNLSATLTESADLMIEMFLLKRKERFRRNRELTRLRQSYLHNIKTGFNDGLSHFNFEAQTIIFDELMIDSEEPINKNII